MLTYPGPDTGSAYTSQIPSGEGNAKQALDQSKINMKSCHLTTAHVLFSLVMQNIILLVVRAIY